CRCWTRPGSSGWSRPWSHCASATCTCCWWVPTSGCCASWCAPNCWRATTTRRGTSPDCRVRWPGLPGTRGGPPPARDGDYRGRRASLHLGGVVGQPRALAPAQGDVRRVRPLLEPVHRVRQPPGGLGQVGGVDLLDVAQP